MASDNEMIINSLNRIQTTLNDSILEQGKANVQYQMGIESLKKRQDKTEQTVIKNTPVIAFAEKLQSNMTKIVTGLIIAVGGSWVVGSANNQPAEPKPEIKTEAKK